MEGHPTFQSLIQLFRVGCTSCQGLRFGFEGRSTFRCRGRAALRPRGSRRVAAPGEGAGQDRFASTTDGKAMLVRQPQEVRSHGLGKSGSPILEGLGDLRGGGFAGEHADGAVAPRQFRLV